MWGVILEAVLQGSVRVYGLGKGKEGYLKLSGFWGCLDFEAWRLVK
jgi:hypothetical protein